MEESSEPAVLGIPRYRSEEAISKVRGLVGNAFSEWGGTEIRADSDMVQRRSRPLQPVFMHALIAGLVPPFSSFLLQILRHYQIHLLHLRPASVAILATFAFFCEGFLGVRPSVAVFCHFYSLRTTAPGVTGCVSFRLNEHEAA